MLATEQILWMIIWLVVTNVPSLLLRRTEIVPSATMRNYILNFLTPFMSAIAMNPALVLRRNLAQSG